VGVGSGSYGDGDGGSYDYGYGSGNGHGYGDGDGYGDGGGFGSGNGHGHGYGYGYGNGNGHGYGDGDGFARSLQWPAFEAWHYVDNGKTRPSSTHPSVEVEPGLVMTLEGEPKCCGHGLHASLKKEHARKYAKPGWMLCRVKCSGLVDWQDDKLACTRREVVEVVGVERW